MGDPSGAWRAAWCSQSLKSPRTSGFGGLSMKCTQNVYLKQLQEPKQLACSTPRAGGPRSASLARSLGPRACPSLPVTWGGGEACVTATERGERPHEGGAGQRVPGSASAGRHDLDFTASPTALRLFFPGVTRKDEEGEAPIHSFVTGNCCFPGSTGKTNGSIISCVHRALAAAGEPGDAVAGGGDAHGSGCATSRPCTSVPGPLLWGRHWTRPPHVHRVPAREASPSPTPLTAPRTPPGSTCPAQKMTGREQEGPTRRGCAESRRLALVCASTGPPGGGGRGAARDGHSPHHEESLVQRDGCEVEDRGKHGLPERKRPSVPPPALPAAAPSAERWVPLPAWWR